MMVVVLPAQIVDVAGADQRPPELTSDPHDALVALVLRLEPVLLDLEVDVVGAERADQLVRVGTRLVRVAAQERLAELRLQTAGERDDPFGVRSDQLHVAGGPAALVAVEESSGGELDQIAAPGQ